MAAESKWVRVVILEEEGNPHVSPAVPFKVIVMRPEDREGENDPVKELVAQPPPDESGEEGMPTWAVVKEFDLEIQQGNPLQLKPVAEAEFFFHGPYREAHPIWVGYIYLFLRMYAALREALGIMPSDDGYRWQPFEHRELSSAGPHVWNPNDEEFCTLVGQVFGPESEAAQREAFKKSS